MKFDFEVEKIDFKFYLNVELVSVYFVLFLIFLIYGEDLVIDIVCYYCDFFIDFVLK